MKQRSAVISGGHKEFKCVIQEVSAVNEEENSYVTVELWLGDTSTKVQLTSFEEVKAFLTVLKWCAASVEVKTSSSFLT